MDSITSGISGLQNYSGQLAKASGFGSDDFASKSASFSNMLGNAINGLNGNINAMDQATAATVAGTNNDLGSVMIKMTEAQLSVQTAVQVRDKVIDAYNDIKNMQF